MSDQAPIKRHEALVTLSRDHHFGLLLAWKIKKGLAGSIAPERISNYVLYFFDNDLQRHFHEEENIVFSKLQADDAWRLQAEAEHGTIYNLIDEIRKHKQDNSLLQQFAEVLGNHIRFEERKLFNYLQEKLPPEQLEEIKLHTAQRGGDCDTGWDDHYWLMK